MKVSLNIVKQFTDVDVSVDELVQKINQQLGGVEEVIDLGARYKDAVIAKVVNCEKHPNADKLSVCVIDVGIGENVQVVCGAPNVREGIFVVWLPPASIVPSSFDDKEPFVLEPKELRGVMSNGMLASAKELAIGDDHDGILEIDPNEWRPNDIDITPGVSFAVVYDLDDYVIDIENKMFTHRPDLFGQLGVAREISAIIKGVPDDNEDFEDQRFVNPDWYWLIPQFETANGIDLDVFNDAIDKVPRFMAVALQGIEVGLSPLWLRCALVAMGSKPINNIVDATNYIMLLTAQPTHAYDYDKLRGRTLGARMAKSGETVKLLNDKTYKLDETDIVIADGEGPVGLAGIMGGGDSEVSNDTKNIVLEVATFDMYTVRKSSMRHGVFTDALTRFNKGQSPLQNDRIVLKLMTLIKQIAGGEQASRVFDEPDTSDELAEVSLSGEIQVSDTFINDRLGTTLTTDQIGGLLRRANFASYVPEDNPQALLITAPFWRTDIELPEDIVEEVGRLYGFDKLPRELPRRSIRPVAKNETRQLKQQIRESLSRAGANEVLTYSFVHGKLLEDVELLEHAEEHAAKGVFKLSNALSPDLQYYRPRVLPSLLEKVHPNIKDGYDEFALFEIGKGHDGALDPDDEGLPREPEYIDIVYTAKTPHQGAAFYHVRRLLDQLASDLGREFVYTPNPYAASTWLVDPARSAHVGDKASGSIMGLIGEPKPSIVRKLKLPTYTATATLNVKFLLGALQTTTNTYRPLSRYPSTERDICFQVTTDTAYAQIVQAAQAVLDDTQLETAISPVDLYQPEDGDTKNVTIRIKLTAHDRTLTGEEVAKIIEQVASVVIEQTQATIV